MTPACGQTAAKPSMIDMPAPVPIYVGAGSGGRGIRTHEDGVTALAVFKTAAIGH
jgi:hypothetical protein